MKIKAYKGFNHDMTCRDFQYEEGKTYKTDKVELCKSGFHACMMPSDVFDYYGFTEDEDSLFYEVEMNGEIDNTSTGNSKIAATEISIKSKLRVSDILRLHGSFVYDNYTITDNLCKYFYSNCYERVGHINEKAKYISIDGYKCIAAKYGNNSSVLNMGYQSISAVVGYGNKSLSYNNESIAASCERHNISITAGRYCIAAATGVHSNTMCTEDFSISANTSYGGIAKNSGVKGISIASKNGQAVTTGKRGIAICSGDIDGAGFTVSTNDESISININPNGTAESKGDRSIAIAVSDPKYPLLPGARAIVTKKNSVAIAKGPKSRGKGVIGSFIIFIYEDGKGETKIKTIHIDGKKYKPDQWYCIFDGKVEEVEEYELYE